MIPASAGMIQNKAQTPQRVRGDSRGLMQLIDHLLTRRSTSVRLLTPPAPNAAQLETMLRVATRVPDHGKLAPWRIRVLHEAGQQKLGALAADIFARKHPDATEAQLAFEKKRFTQAPLVLAVLSTPVESIKAPLWEQQLSASAVCLNILYACKALGFGATWLTEWVAYDAEILAALLSTHRGHNNHCVPDAARIAGFLYIGTQTQTPDERERPALEDVVEVWD